MNFSVRNLDSSDVTGTCCHDDRREGCEGTGVWGRLVVRLHCVVSGVGGHDQLCQLGRREGGGRLIFGVVIV